MRGAVMYGPGDVRVEDRAEPRIVDPTDAVIRVSAACVCDSDLWPYRGIGTEEATWPMSMGHEYVGVVEEVGADVETIRPGQFVVGSFWASDNTCPICRADTRAPASTASPRAPWERRPSSCASRSPTAPSSPLPTSPPTTWCRACSPHPTCSVPAGSPRSLPKPARAGPPPPSETAPRTSTAARRLLPELIDLIWSRRINPAKVFDLELPLEDTAAGYEAMDERRSIKALLHP